eukprot:scaffold97083_cov46-Tisochrysis_lutea.AAC.1
MTAGTAAAVPVRMPTAAGRTAARIAGVSPRSHKSCASWSNEMLPPPYAPCSSCTRERAHPSR